MDTSIVLMPHHLFRFHFFFTSYYLLYRTYLSCLSSLFLSLGVLEMTDNMSCIAFVQLQR